jgi:hypothetical protein
MRAAEDAHDDLMSPRTRADESRARVSLIAGTAAIAIGEHGVEASGSRERFTRGDEVYQATGYFSM